MNTLLARSGYSRVRFFSIQGKDGKALCGVDLHHLDVSGMVDHVVHAHRLYMFLDENEKELRLFSPKAEEFDGKNWKESGDRGWEMVLPMINVDLWKGLGYGIVEKVSRPGKNKKKVRLFPARERRRWLSTFYFLLNNEPGLTGRFYRVNYIGNLTETGFKDAEILGYSRKGRLLERFKAGVLTVHASKEEGIKFIMRHGFHETEKGRIPVPA